MSNTLFHFSFAVSDLDQARKFYGDMLQCPEGRKLKGRADFNFFGHHIVAHHAPDDIVGDKGRKIGDALATPLRHFGVVMALDDFQKASTRLEQQGAEWINKPSVTQKGTVREQMLMTVSDGCGNAIEFKGLVNIADVYRVEEREKALA
jgi:uncharacterized protein